MTQTVATRDAILAELVAESTLSGIRTVEYVGGHVDEELLERYGPHAPALLLTWLGAGESRFTFVSQLLSSWAIFVVTKKRVRHTDAQNFHDLVFFHLLHGTRWGETACGAPQNISSKNLYSARFDKAGLEVIAIQWDQWVELPENDGSALPDFLELNTCYYGELAEHGLWSDKWASLWSDSCAVEELQTLVVS